jgi:origin recognition complex subunit 3
LAITIILLNRRTIRYRSNPLTWKKAANQSQGCFVFNPDEDHERPSKRRRVSKKHQTAQLGEELPSVFVPLLNGLEKAESVKARERLFNDSWSRIDVQVQVCLDSPLGSEIQLDMLTDRCLQRILRESNQATLDDVTAFMKETNAER